jgi:hypothetical protein
MRSAEKEDRAAAQDQPREKENPPLADGANEDQVRRCSDPTSFARALRL